jgi:thiamine kinase-like enzyme
MDLHRRTRELFAAEAMVMVNTEVNSHNFIVDRQNRAGADGARLVDWEKAVVSPRYQDLGHFTVATTTRWKADVVLSAHDKSRFLSAYARELERLGAPVPAMEDLEAATGVLERAILLRALSWCYMAWYEYTQTDRPIRNPDTFAKIGAYLDESECLLH